ncbi:transposon ty3-g gap-pol polyprotein [Lasius niger]|uniref:Transposon ty3-g gap-pol polyprotein n=1 Tax=Lasius niger TaxID=67767 RepID=A0A0J7K1V0_LASNI|nr:transposon ty3-g gap-pol polyprotein [Lasius niger]
MAQNGSNSQEVGRVSIRSPQFSKEKPTIWFIQMEAQFATSGITQDLTKFYHSVQVLDASVLAERRKTFEDTTKSNRIREPTTVSTTKTYERLAEGKMSDELLKSLWMQRLLTNTQIVLSTSEDALDKLATMADRIHDIVSTNICNMEVTPATTSTTSWEGQLCEIIKRLDRIESKKRSSTPRRQRGRSCSKSRTRSTSTGSNYCWYHKRFGQEAKKCTSPCG